MKHAGPYVRVENRNGDGDPYLGIANSPWELLWIVVTTIWNDSKAYPLTYLDENDADIGERDDLVGENDCDKALSYLGGKPYVFRPFQVFVLVGILLFERFRRIEATLGFRAAVQEFWQHGLLSIPPAFWRVLWRGRPGVVKEKKDDK